jgi:hypothetical protein
VRAQTQVVRHPVVVESAVRGQSLAALLQTQPHRLEDTLEAATEWLATWNAATRIESAEITGHLERLVLAPSARLAPIISTAGGFQAWLRDRCARVQAPLTLVSAHHDLTTWNLLVDRGDGIGVVDWATAERNSLPLTDFFYLVTDAVTMATGGPQRVAAPRALEACLAPWGRHTHLIRRLLHSVTDRLALSEEMVELAVWACFIRHALNERALAQLGDQPRFGKSVEWLYANRDEVRAWLGG